MGILTDEAAAALTARCDGLLVDWLNRLPEPAGSTGAWLRQLLDGEPDLRRAMGLPTNTGELEATRVLIDDDSPAFRTWRSHLNQRLQIYLGGVEGLSTSSEASPDLRGLCPKVHALREMIGHEPRAWPRTPRTLTAVRAAVGAGSLRTFMTSEADSELWVVLKTLQEHSGTGENPEHLVPLIDWVTDLVRAETRYPGQHISDRRHAWWAVRTLYEAADAGYVSSHERLLDQFLRQLIAEPVYLADPIAIGASLVPDFHPRIVVGWELINISELMRGWPSHIDGDLLVALHEREEILMGDLVADAPPVDMRVATVYARAGITYLSNGLPRLWGKDV